MTPEAIPDNEKEIRKDWDNLLKQYWESYDIRDLIEDIGDELFIRKEYTNRKGEFKWGYEYPTEEQIIEKFGNRINKLSEPESFIDDYIGLDFYRQHDRPYGDSHDFFWGDSCYGFGYHELEDPTILEFPYHFAFGGPTIYLSFFVKFDYKIKREEIKVYNSKWIPKKGKNPPRPMPSNIPISDPIIKDNWERKQYLSRIRDIWKVTKLDIDIHKIKYVSSWYLRGAALDLTDDHDAQSIYETEFEEQIYMIIQSALESGELELPGKRKITHE